MLRNVALVAEYVFIDFFEHNMNVLEKSQVSNEKEIAIIIKKITSLIMDCEENYVNIN